MPESDVHVAVADLVADALGVSAEGLSEATRFDTLDHWTSFTSLLVLTRVEEQVGVRLDLRTYLAGQTIGDLVAMITSARAGR